ncbi:MAG TPA: response regulator [Candidatus Krumholzibacteria bacterium]|nr:response regulator [Candidatus Krumholzibacteria bacterium]
MDTVHDRPLVLVVEDDPDLRRILCLQLAKIGYATVEAENGRVGFDRAKNAAPDLILLDLMMPELDGFQVLKRIKSLDSLTEIPVLILTASHDDHHRRKSVSHMANGFMTKPYTLDQLREEIGRLLAPAEKA